MIPHMKQCDYGFTHSIVPTVPSRLVSLNFPCVYLTFLIAFLCSQSYDVVVNLLL